MGVSHIFEIVQMVANRAMHHYVPATVIHFDSFAHFPVTELP